MNKLRVGLTMRVTQEADYVEARDAIAQDWFKYLRRILPQASVMLLPNLGNKIVDYAASWDLNGFILTGGNDYGKEPLRDETEMLLLKHATQYKKPTLGICRGLQMLTLFSDGQLENVDTKEHIATQHKVKCTPNPFDYPIEFPLTVNSFHGNGIKDAGNLRIIARDKNGYIEAAYSTETPTLGLMWHPERQNPNAHYDDIAIKKLFRA